MNAAVNGAASGVAATAMMSLFLEGAKAAGYLDREPPAIITDNFEDEIDAPVIPGASFRTRWISVHTAFGGAMGGVFGLLREALPRNTVAAGALFGAGLWTAMYPLALPAVGLYPKPDEDYEPRAWTIALGHFVYGVSLAAAFDAMSERRGIR